MQLEATGSAARLSCLIALVLVVTIPGCSNDPPNRHDGDPAIESMEAMRSTVQKAAENRGEWVPLGDEIDLQVKINETAPVTEEVNGWIIARSVEAGFQIEFPGPAIDMQNQGVSKSGKSFGVHTLQTKTSDGSTFRAMKLIGGEIKDEDTVQSIHETFQRKSGSDPGTVRIELVHLGDVDVVEFEQRLARQYEILRCYRISQGMIMLSVTFLREPTAEDRMDIGRFFDSLEILD